MSPGVRPVVLEAGPCRLSALIAQPQGTPRATVVAVHGGGMRAGYFDGQAHPDVSLLALGAALGYTVVAVDRPGYGLSASQLPYGQDLSEQSALLGTALAHLVGRYPTGAGVFLVAHSFGGKLALTYAAAQDGRDGLEAGAPPLLGMDVSGCGRDYAVDTGDLRDPHRHGHWKRNWGPCASIRPTPSGTPPPWSRPCRCGSGRRPRTGRMSFAAAAARVPVPVRLTFAERELWWRHSEEDLAELAGLFTASPFVTVDRQPEAGHNISLGWAARAYHLRALAFLEECLARAGAPA